MSAGTSLPCKDPPWLSGTSWCHFLTCPELINVPARPLLSSTARPVPMSPPPPPLVHSTMVQVPVMPNTGTVGPARQLPGSHQLLPSHTTGAQKWVDTGNTFEPAACLLPNTKRQAAEKEEKIQSRHDDCSSLGKKNKFGDRRPPTTTRHAIAISSASQQEQQLRETSSTEAGRSVFYAAPTTNNNNRSAAARYLRRTTTTRRSPEDQDATHQTTTAKQHQQGRQGALPATMPRIREEA